MVNIPVYGGGHINSAEDVADLFTAGCEKVVLNFGKECHDLLRQVADAYGRNRIAVSIASADNIVINKAILEENASELVLIDEHALKTVSVQAHCHVLYFCRKSHWINCFP